MTLLLGLMILLWILILWHRAQPQPTIHKKPQPVVEDYEGCGCGV